MLADVSLAGLGADDVDGVAGLLQAQAGVLEFEVFVNFLDEDRDFSHGVILPHSRSIDNVCSSPSSRNLLRQQRTSRALQSGKGDHLAWVRELINSSLTHW